MIVGLPLIDLSEIRALRNGLSHTGSEFEFQTG